jgi:arylsulfatase A-like enzyme
MSARPPNFVVFLADDHGYGDLSCMGSTDVRTPFLDGVARDGALFTNWYANSPVCSPSRASLLTGRYPANAGVRTILGGLRSTPGLPPSVPTLATALRGLGYRTGMFGKWHLGLAPGYQPGDHGFEEWFGFMGGWVDYFSHVYYFGQAQQNTIQVHDLWEDGREVFHNGRYMTELLTERAVDFVERAASDAERRPFFLYVPYSAPHYPMHAPRPYLDRFPELPAERRIMAAMLAALDDGVGAVLDGLERHGVAEDTLVFYQSDNGPSRESCNWLDGRPDAYRGGCACPLTGHKFSLFDGGIRSPAVMRWPSRVPPGRTVDGVGVAMDLFPTLLAAAGGDVTSYELDGSDVLPMIAGEAPSPHAGRPVFWEFGRQTAARLDRWKLVLDGRRDDGPAPAVHLSDLDADPGETTNLADARPRVRDRVVSMAAEWRRAIEERWTREWASAPGVGSSAGSTTEMM